MKGKEVVVTDTEERFLEPTHPAKARKLMRNGKADLISKDPPAIRLRNPIEPTPGRKFSMNGERARIQELTKFFEVEQDIYVQNISDDPRIVLIEFKVDRETITFTLPEGRDPICLTGQIPFSSIKNSVDFRRMAQRRPPVMRLMTAEEYQKYFETKVETRKLVGEFKEVQELIEDAERKAVEVHQKKVKTKDRAPSPPQSLDQAIKDEQFVTQEEVIQPRVLWVVRQCDKEMKTDTEDNRMPASEALDALQALTLTDDDLNYIHGMCHYPQISKWAKMEMNQKSSLENIVDSGTKEVRVTKEEEMAETDAKVEADEEKAKKETKKEVKKGAKKTAKTEKPKARVSTKL